MICMNLDNIDKETLFFCYSPNLCEFIKLKTDLFPIYEGVHRKKGTKFIVFIKCDDLQNCLDEWKENKLKGIFAIPKQNEKLGELI